MEIRAIINLGLLRDLLIYESICEILTENEERTSGSDLDSRVKLKSSVREERIKLS